MHFLFTFLIFCNWFWKVRRVSVSGFAWFPFSFASVFYYMMMIKMWLTCIISKIRKKWSAIIWSLFGNQEIMILILFNLFLPVQQRKYWGCNVILTWLTKYNLTLDTSVFQFSSLLFMFCRFNECSQAVLYW